MNGRMQKAMKAGVIAASIGGVILVGAAAFAAGDRGGRHHRGF